MRFKIGDTVWKCDLVQYECSKAPAGNAPADVPSNPRTRGRFQGRPDGEEQGPGDNRRSPDGRWTAFIKDHDVHVRSADGSGSESIRLSSDGKEGLAYGWLSWSPDSRTLAAYRIEPGDHKEVYLIQSSPPGGGRARFRAGLIPCRATSSPHTS